VITEPTSMAGKQGQGLEKHGWYFLSFVIWTQKMKKVCIKPEESQFFSFSNSLANQLFSVSMMKIIPWKK